MILCRDGRLVNNRFFEIISTHRAFRFGLDFASVKILCNACYSLNSTSSSLRKERPMLVDTFLLNGGGGGGLYQIK